MEGALGTQRCYFLLTVQATWEPSDQAMRTRTGSKNLIREINQAIVLDTVRTLGQVSRAEIALETGLSPATVTGITRELIERNLLREGATGRSAGGRKPVLLQLNASAGYVIGVKVTENEVIAVLTDLDATIIERERENLDHSDVATVVDAVASVSTAWMSGTTRRPIHGLGICIAGAVDSLRGTVRHATYHDWHDVPLAELLEERFGLPITVDNDANALAATERWFGSGRHAANMLVISLGRGVGLGMVLNGRLYRGTRGGAGEFGHVKIAQGGPPCDCGSSGCLETMVGDNALIREIARRIGRNVSIEEAVRLARDGEAAALEVFNAAAEALGRATANLVNVLNPDVIVFSGEGARAADIFQPTVEAALIEHTFDGLGQDVEIVVQSWDDEAWARGAASLLLGELFQPQLHQPGTRRPSLLAQPA